MNTDQLADKATEVNLFPYKTTIEYQWYIFINHLSEKETHGSVRVETQK